MNGIRRHSEAAFEDCVESGFIASGFLAIAEVGFDRERAIFPSVVLDFIRKTQPKEWEKLEALHSERTGSQIVSDLCKWLDAHGTLSTLRHGFKCYGRTIRIAYFKASHDLNPELEARYAANVCGITRQLHYCTRNNNSLDLCLSINGIPVVTLELKNAQTGQTVDDAMKQYRNDREPREPIFEFKRRTLVQFAMDTDCVMMTTRLAGSATHFLPFNVGDKGGAGNPVNANGHRTSYLWEECLYRESFLDIFARFVHLQVEHRRNDEGRKITKETMIFPRYHQLRAVRKLVARARNEGPGNNYLIEHSAGSGKSNTIGWLAHRLASLHDNQNRRVFDSVIVITDRRVLDQQLQDTIYQFEHRQGVVQKIDESSRQLAEALEAGVPVIISTLQKFPFVTSQLAKMAEERGEAFLGVLPTRKCAVIIDEAHSSQSGESATDLREVLGGQALIDAARKAAKEENADGFEELYRSMAKRGKQANLSLFAFTATPKHKTLKIFGDDGEPADRYTMRQAIEEGFILDVLKNYTTYETYFKLLKASQDDKEVERKKAAKVLARYMKRHPVNIAQKTAVMVEHFNSVSRHKIGGRAKAMVVTGSRLEAVRYKESFDRYIADKGYPIRTLVAFSGSVTDDKVPDKLYTEEGMNHGVKESELSEVFGTTEYQVLLVAEKYQTGFDQPLLHTMYIDRRLFGIQAVQTLSRLNRVHPLKEDTFVLDFVNDREEIREAFTQFFDGAELGESADPNRMYEIRAELTSAGVFLNEEVNRFCEVYFKPKTRQSSVDHREMNACIDPAVDRFTALKNENDDEAELWRGKLQSFISLYSFLSQVIPYQDSDLERLYTFLRHLGTKLPKKGAGPQYNFDEDVRLEYYRLQKIAEGSISLHDDQAKPLDGPKEMGSGKNREEGVPLSRLIDTINQRFGTEFTEADQFFFDQIASAAVEDETLQQAAMVNPEDKFALVFNRVLETLFVERLEQNEDIFGRFMNDGEFQSIVKAQLLGEVYRRLRKAMQKALPLVESEPVEPKPNSRMVAEKGARYDAG